MATSKPQALPAIDLSSTASEHKQQMVSRQYSICVKQHSICVNALRDEFGVSPGAETSRLFHDLTAAHS
jgi:hypothetical protein